MLILFKSFSISVVLQYLFIFLTTLIIIGMVFGLISSNSIVMENLSVRLEKKIFRYRYLLAAIIIGVVLFGIIFPNSLSDHYHLLHFAAHFGMSFLIANAIYQFCTRRASMKKMPTFVLIFIAVLIFGTVYKFIEMFCFYNMGDLPFFNALALAGFYASMSLNLSGMLASFAMAIYFDFLMPSVSKISQLKS